MSDLEVSSSNSEPVSDVNPEEMARLMADLDEIDNDLFKNTLKSSAKSADGSTAPKTQDKKDFKKQVTSDKKPVTSAKKATAKPLEDDDEDWDADDLLQSDDEVKPRGPSAKKLESSEAIKSSPAKAANFRKKDGLDIPESSKTTTTTSKSKLMADLFSENSEDVTKDTKMNKSPSAYEFKKDKSKLMTDLFGETDGSSPDKLKPSTGGGQNGLGRTAARRGPAKKAKDDIVFDDDDDLLGGLGETRGKPGPVKDSGKSGSFLDSLLKKGSSENPKAKKEKSPEFVLDDKYRNMGKNVKDEKRDFGGYVPSASKLDSPLRRTPNKSVSNDNFDLFSDKEPKRRNPRSASHRKTFEVDDDDILGNIRSRKEGNKDGSQSLKTKDTAKGITKSPAKVQNKDDWLFGDSGSVTDSAKKNIDDTQVTASIEKVDDSIIKPSPSKSQDWLGNLLASSTKSPMKAASRDSSPNLKQLDVSRSVPGSASPSALRADIRASSVSLTPSANHGTQASPIPAANLPLVMPTVTGIAHPAPAVVSTVPAMSSTVEAGNLYKKLEHQFSTQQEEVNAQAAAIAAQLQQNQNQLEMHMAQQLQQQQQQMADMMKRYKDAVSTSHLNTPLPLNNEDDHHKVVQVDLRTAEVEVEKLKAELNLLRKQHAEEIAMLEDGYRRKMDVEKEVWGRVEKRLREERDSLLSDFQIKISLVQEEKENLASSYEAQVASIKSEWSQAVERTKELYSGMIERMKEEHHVALERISQLKELELKAILSATGQVREVEAVMTQLESNTSNLSELTASINTRHDSALELTQRALKMKEKQLQEFEAQLATSRAESENERRRLSTLIQRLESTLMQQGSEVEKEKWRLAQERMKVEMERQAITEERKHLQTSTETERQNLAIARESLMAEHRSLLQSVNQQKQELATQQAHISIQQKLAHISAPETNITGGNVNQMTIAAEMTAINDKHRCLHEKITAVNYQEKRLKEEETRLEELSLQVDQEKTKLKLERDIIAQEQMFLVQTRKEIETARTQVDVCRHEQEVKLNQITSQTRALHVHQERLENDHLKLEQLREEVIRLSQFGLCASCQARGAAEFVLDRMTKSYNRRLPGDGGEGHINSSFKVDNHYKVNMSPASVLARLAAAREHENVEREKKLLQISAMDFS
ncbi:fas-binding factor 1 homolog [Procambarus clarkii]|uniref:fas-binding factor 1 homolog n=1 Tax=Procambarus clarkii TaxID=6728 RepID=UPI003744B07D